MSFILSKSRQKQVVKDSGENMPKGNFFSQERSDCGCYRIVVDGNDDFWMSVPRKEKIELYPMEKI